MLGFQLVELFGKIRGCDLVGGGVSLQVSFELSKAQAILTECSPCSPLLSLACSCSLNV